MVLDHQSLTGGPQDNIYDKDYFVASWVNLVKSVVAEAPETNGKLLIDFINEPDGWASSAMPPGVPNDIQTAYCSSVCGLYPSG